MLGQTEFLALCTFLENTEHQSSIDTERVRVYETLLRVVQLGIQSDSGIKRKEEKSGHHGKV